jgi:DNA uptake protein ComE-like DNA-binding protein
MTGVRQHRARTGKVAAILSGLLVLAAAMPADAYTPSASAPAAAPGAKAKPKPAPVKRIDINSASRTELKKLANIGDAEADRIIANRPFLTSAEIIEKAGIPAGVYAANKRRMVAMPKTLPRKPAAKP